MRISLIAAMARNRVIGRDGALPWHLPDDFAHFKQTTAGHTVVMGRRTFLSMGKPLPNRRNILLTSSPDFRPPGVEVVADLHAAIRLAADHGESELFIIGGSRLYEDALPLAHRLYLTLVDADPPGDTLFPPFNWDDWSITSKEHHPADDRHAYPFEILTLDRKHPV